MAKNGCTKLKPVRQSRGSTRKNMDEPEHREVMPGRPKRLTGYERSGTVIRGTGL